MGYKKQKKLKNFIKLTPRGKGKIKYFVSWQGPTCLCCLKIISEIKLFGKIKKFTCDFATLKYIRRFDYLCYGYILTPLACEHLGVIPQGELYSQLIQVLIFRPHEIFAVLSDLSIMCIYRAGIFWFFK